ncbi:Probable protein kinase UbiB (Ubiquinone biosynthesis protein UbiB) [Durusdinium trenchii]|uniref:Probable protein kinase UbiB (Ubiquinone biosynthesis protein UbiB) n=1 Tax=Durusdinium trenchii TaxID=1381693 RepID=A0ABP0P819_9DINO
MDDVERILLEDLGLKLSDLFESFDPKPIAAASIAQVHAARLRSGELCVVKVVRPHVRERLSADFAAATLFARLADLVLGEANWTGPVSSFPESSAGFGAADGQRFFGWLCGGCNRPWDFKRFAS